MGIKVVSMFWLLLALLLWTPVYMYLCLQFVGYILINGVARSKVWILKAMAFPQSFESWTIKKPESQRTNAFKLWCWRRLLRVPWIARRLNQSILKEINPEYSLEGLTLKLKLQYFAHLMQRAKSLKKTLMLGKIEGMRRRRQQRMRWLDGIIGATDTSLSKPWEILKDREGWWAAVQEVRKSLKWLSD